MCSYLQNLDISQKYCGEYNINLPIKAAQQVQMYSVSVVSDLIAVSIQTKTISDRTVIFLGTDKGDLVKV